MGQAISFDDLSAHAVSVAAPLLKRNGVIFAVVENDFLQIAYNAEPGKSGREAAEQLVILSTKSLPNDDSRELVFSKGFVNEIIAMAGSHPSPELRLEIMAQFKTFLDRIDPDLTVDEINIIREAALNSLMTIGRDDADGALRGKAYEAAFVVAFSFFPSKALSMTNYFQTQLRTELAGKIVGKGIFSRGALTQSPEALAGCINALSLTDAKTGHLEVRLEHKQLLTFKSPIVKAAAFEALTKYEVVLEQYCELALLELRGVDTTRAIREACLRTLFKHARSASEILYGNIVQALIDTANVDPDLDVQWMVFENFPTLKDASPKIVGTLIDTLESKRKSLRWWNCMCTVAARAAIDLASDSSVVFPSETLALIEQKRQFLIDQINTNGSYESVRRGASALLHKVDPSVSLEGSDYACVIS